MKRASGLFLAVIVCLVVASQASANAFSTPGSYDVKFNGYEYAYWGEHSEFMKGAVSSTISSQDDLLKPDTSLNTGFSMTAVTYFTSVNTVDKNGAPVFPASYSPEPGAGAYIAVLRDLKAGFSSGSLAQGNAMMYFTGGALDWYFLPTAAVNDFSRMVYSAGVGLADAAGTLVAKLAGLTPFAEFALSETITLNAQGQPQNFTGSAKVSLENGYLMGDAKFFADDVTAGGGMFDSNLFNGHDMSFQATLNWNPLLGRFKVNDPASLHVPTPEAGTLSLMALGLLLTGLFIRRRGER